MIAAVTVVLDEPGADRLRRLGEEPVLSPLIGHDLPRPATFGSGALDQPMVGREPLRLIPDGAPGREEHPLLEMLGVDRGNAASQRRDDSLEHAESRGRLSAPIRQDANRVLGLQTDEPLEDGQRRLLAAEPDSGLAEEPIGLLTAVVDDLRHGVDPPCLP